MTEKRLSLRAQTEKLRESLKTAGLRSTLPRVQLLRIFKEKKGHFSADELHSLLSERGVLLPRASVYNAVNDFRSRGLIQEVDVGSGKAVFEDAHQAAHHHFTCRGCGQIQDIPCEVVASPCIDHSIDNVKIEEVRIIFRGLCEECRQQELSSNSRRRQSDVQL